MAEDNKFPSYTGDGGTKFFTDGEDVGIHKGDNRGLIIPVKDLLGWQKSYMTWLQTRNGLSEVPENFGSRTIGDMTKEEACELCWFFIDKEDYDLHKWTSQMPRDKIEMIFRNKHRVDNEEWIYIDAAFDIRWESRTPGHINTFQIYGQMKIVKYLLERGFNIFG